MTLLCAAATPAPATQVRIFETQSQAGFLAGTLEGVSVDSLGRMELAPRAERVTSLSEPFLLSAAAASDGWVVGTGNAGKVLWIDRKGKATELLAAAEPEVFAVWALYGAIALAILVTYSRIPHEELYHVSDDGLSGGLSRVLVFVNWPGALIATVVLGIVFERERRPVIALVALSLCLVIFIPGVLDQADLDVQVLDQLVVGLGFGDVVVHPDIGHERVDCH